jgi:ribosomal-protein-alanine N-acetyltransferase
VAFTIRDYAPADFDTLWRIDQACFPPGIAYSRTELKFYLKRPASFTLVAARIPETQAETGKDKKKTGSIRASDSEGEDSVEIAGFIVAEAGPRARGHIVTIDVVAEARRFGVGSLLLRAAEDRLLLASCRAVELETAVDNLSALAFYGRRGYSVVKTHPRYYSNGLDALVLEKVLA